MELTLLLTVCQPNSPVIVSPICTCKYESTVHIPVARRPHILLGVTGSVAAIRSTAVAKLLCEFAEVQIIATDAARKLLSEEDLSELARLQVPIRGGSLRLLLRRICYLKEVNL